MDDLQPYSVLVAHAIAFGVVAGVLAFYRATQRTYPGYRDWLLGTGAMAAALLALAFVGRGGHPPPPANLAANLLGVAAIDRLYRGTVRFGGAEPTLRRLDAAVYGAGLAAYALWLLVSPNASRRLVVASLCVAWAIGRATLAAKRLARGAYRASGLLLSAATAGMTVAVLLHAGAVLARPEGPPLDLVRRTPLETAIITFAIAPAILAALAFLFLNARRTMEELEEALGRVRQLEGVIHICMHCKRVRVEADSWDRIEKYVADHSLASFSHGICPDCFVREYRGP